MKAFRTLVAMGCFAALVAGSPVRALQSDDVPMFCSIRAMVGASRNYFVTDIFWGDYNDNLRYRNRFAAWVNANYGSMGGQYASYCWYGEDQDAAYSKRDRIIHEERSSGNNVIPTRWRS